MFDKRDVGRAFKQVRRPVVKRQKTMAKINISYGR